MGIFLPGSRRAYYGWRESNRGKGRGSYTERTGLTCVSREKVARSDHLVERNSVDILKHPYNLFGNADGLIFIAVL